MLNSWFAENEVISITKWHTFRYTIAQFCNYSNSVMFIAVLVRIHSQICGASVGHYKYVDHSLVRVFSMCSVLGSLHHSSLVISQLVVLCDI